MPRVHKVNKARKDHGDNIKKGDTYYWWKFNYGPKVKSKKYPARSQLTRSEFLGAYYDLVDNFSPTEDSVADDLQNLIDGVNELLEMQQDSYDNMPDGLRDTDSGQLLEERIGELDGWISDLESIDADSWEENAKEGLEATASDQAREEARQEAFEELVQEIQDTDPGSF